MQTFISLTSIFDNQQALIHTLNSIKQQTLKPDKCFVFLSTEPYLLDKGFADQQLPANIEAILRDDLFEIRWVANTGPYRKLLPILQEKIDEDCVIIAVDDDTSYEKNMIENYINDFNTYNCVIASRSYTMKFENVQDISYKDRDTINRLNVYNFHTGKGGVLYHPKFFRNSASHIFDSMIYKEVCPFGDDIWFNFHRIANKINCYIPPYSSYVQDNTTRYGLWNNINSKNNTNTIYMRKTIQKLKELGYDL